MSKRITAADLPEDLARFAEAQVAAGHFATVEDVLRAGKEVLEARQRRYAKKMDELRAAIAEGDASPDFEGNPFASVRARLGISDPSATHR
jgi:putative addiction module CopG family antidote